MLDPPATRMESNHMLKRIAHAFEGSNEDLIEALKDKLKGKQIPEPYSEVYKGKPNQLLDRYITKEEVYSVIMDVKKNSAPGSDGITNAIIRNLDDRQVEELQNIFTIICGSRAKSLPMS